MTDSSYKNQSRNDGFGSGTVDGTESPQSFTVHFHGSIPLVTYILLGICVILYLLQWLSQLLTGSDIPFVLGGKINQLIMAGQYWRFFTPMLLHGSILHLAVNMYALVVLGRTIESYFGRWRFLALFVVSGFAGNVLSFIFSPNPSLGSSTAIFGLLAAEVVFVYQNRKYFGKGAKSILINAVSVAGFNLILGLSPGIDNWGHMGGLLGGILFTIVGGPLWGVSGIIPNLEITDQRSKARIILAVELVLFVFISAAFVTIYIRR